MTNQWKYRRTNSDFFKDLRNLIVDRVENLQSVNEQLRALDEMADDEQYTKFAERAARKLVIAQATTNARTWREAARKSMRGRLVYNALRKEKGAFDPLIAQSAEQIKTLPRHIADRIVRRIGELTMQGMRSSDIAKEIQRLIRPYARASSILLARTQVSKTLTTINETRCKSVGIKAYVWHTIGGPRVRDSHAFMNDVVCFWSDPPCPEALAKVKSKELSYYHPGGIYNCRCYAEPLLSVEDITWPHRVHVRGKITRMSKKSFTNLV